MFVDKLNHKLKCQITNELSNINQAWWLNEFKQNVMGTNLSAFMVGIKWQLNIIWIKLKLQAHPFPEFNKIMFTVEY